MLGVIGIGLVSIGMAAIALFLVCVDVPSPLNRGFRGLVRQETRKNRMFKTFDYGCLLYTSPSPRDATLSRMPSSA